MNRLKQQFMSGIDNNSKYPSLDKLHPHKSYAITINPSQEMELKIKGTRERLVSKILPLFHGNVKAYTELSTKSQNVHYHGLITWDNYIEICKFYINIEEIKKECQFEIDELNNPEYWIPYITKSCAHMDAICHYYKQPNIVKFVYYNGEYSYNEYNTSKLY